MIVLKKYTRYLPVNWKKNFRDGIFLPKNLQIKASQLNLRDLYNLNTLGLSEGMSLRPGSPCDNFQGYCDVFFKCRQVIYHLCMNNNIIKKYFSAMYCGKFPIL